MSELANSDHGRFEGDTAAHALNALEDNEARLFERHLAECALCQQELAGMRTVVEVLPAAAPVHAPSPALKERVMATVREETRTLPDPVEAPTRRARPGGRRPGMALPARLSPLVAVAATALIAALVVVGVLTLGGGGGSVRTYAGIVSARGARASVRESGSGAQLRVSGLPAPAPGRIYQVWLKRAQMAPVPTRALFAISSGSVKVPGNLRGVRAVLVTAEPRPHGSRHPTRTPIIVVRLA